MRGLERDLKILELPTNLLTASVSLNTSPKSIDAHHVGRLEAHIERQIPESAHSGMYSPGYVLSMLSAHC